MKNFFNLKNPMIKSSVSTALLIVGIAGIMIYLAMVPKTLNALLIVVTGMLVAFIALSIILVVIDIKLWPQYHKDMALYMAVVEDNIFNARLVLWLGGNPNAAMPKHYGDAKRYYQDEIEHCLDAVKSEEMKALLHKYDATYYKPKH